MYRDFITVGLLVRQLKIREAAGSPVEDNWIYIQEPDVLLGRLQIFNNWSPYLVADSSTTLAGAGVFLQRDRDLWKLSDEKLSRWPVYELSQIGICDAADVLDATVVRMPKTYPAYFGTYDRFDEIRRYLDRFEIYSWSVATACTSTTTRITRCSPPCSRFNNIVAGRTDKHNLWEVNTEVDNHEEKS